MRVTLAHVAREGRRVAVILVDVDSLKDVNDSYGHAVGDAVLRNLANRLSRGVRASDTVARVWAATSSSCSSTGSTSTTAAWQVAERLRDAVCIAPGEPDSDALGVTASFGLAVATAEDTTEELLQRADAAMYRAKSLGGGKVVVFEDGADVSITTLSEELAHTVSHGLIRPHVQPIVDLQTGAVVAYQGIARWEHPRHGLLEAGQFVHTVANTPLLPVIDLAVLRRTAAAAAHAAPQRRPRRRLRPCLASVGRRRRAGALSRRDRRRPRCRGVGPAHRDRALARRRVRRARSRALFDPSATSASARC